eukprot:1746929-Rhodomonas_salina.1
MPRVSPENVFVFGPCQVHETRLEAIAKAVVGHEALPRRGSYEAHVSPALKPSLADEGVVYPNVALPKSP